jgi:hypothetical protein
MNRVCAIRDEELIAFAGGVEFDLDEHVATCDQCQDFLAELWDGGLDHDLVEPVVQMIRLELFLMDAAKLGGGIVADMLQALVTYLDPGLGKDDQ